MLNANEPLRKIHTAEFDRYGLQRKTRHLPAEEGSSFGGRQDSGGGHGSGINIEFYDPEKVELVWGLEPSEGMRLRAADKVAEAPFEIRWLDLPGEEIPLEDNSVDTILLTYTLCTIPGWQLALNQMRRVLNPAGKLIFCEHGEAPDENIRKWQARINPIWKKIAGGCNLNRPIPGCLTESGFKIESLDTMYLPATPRVFGYNYWGVAQKR